MVSRSVPDSSVSPVRAGGARRRFLGLIASTSQSKSVGLILFPQCEQTLGLRLVSGAPHVGHPKLRNRSGGGVWASRDRDRVQRSEVQNADGSSRARPSECPV